MDVPAGSGSGSGSASSSAQVLNPGQTDLAPHGPCWFHFPRRGKSSLMQSQGVELVLSTGFVRTAHTSQHMALGAGWGIWPLSLCRQSRAHPAPGHHLQGKEHICEVVSWAECGSSAVPASLGRYGAGRSPLFSLQLPFLLPCFSGEGSFPDGLPSSRGSQKVSPGK